MYIKTTEFTFHYVSIKSTVLWKRLQSPAHLHSTMYLLNLEETTLERLADIFTFHYVSIKSKAKRNISCGLGVFTFHYVSIKSTFVK